MSAETAIRAVFALECLSKLMDLCDEYDDEPIIKKRKVYVKSEDVECQLLKGIAWNNIDSDDSFCPLTMENFEELCNMVSSKVKKESLVVPTLTIRIRVATTLRYLIAGESHRRLEKVAYVSRKSTQRIVPEMLEILIDILEKEYLNSCKAANEWTNEARDFETFWGFPHALGVLDLRNFQIKTSTTETSSESLILLSVLDSHSRFKYIEMIPSVEGNYSTAYISSRLYKSLKTRSLNIPVAKPLEGQSDRTPYFFVGSEVFGLDRYIIDDYDQTSTITRSQKAFNFRLNRARLPVQMAFEIIYFRFKIFNRLHEIDMDKAKLIIKACCLLHNYLTQKLTQPLDYNEDLTKLELSDLNLPLPKQVNGLCQTEGKTTRDNVCKYFVNEGNIPEQWQNII